MMRGRLGPAILMLLAGSSYGLVSPMLRMAFGHGLGAAQVTDWQYVIAAVVLWMMVGMRRRWAHVSRRQWLIITVIGVCNATLNYCYYLALTALPASIAIVLLFQFAWMVVVIDVVAKHRWPGWTRTVALVIILAGTVLAVGLGRGSWHAYPTWAIAFGLISALAYAVVLYISEYSAASEAPEQWSALQITIAMLLTFIPFTPSHLAEGPFPAALAWSGLIALFSQVLPILLIFTSIPLIGGQMAAILGTIELPVAVFAARWLNAEHVTWFRWAGVLLILAGIVLSEAGINWLRRDTPKPAEGRTG